MEELDCRNCCHNNSTEATPRASDADQKVGSVMSFAPAAVMQGTESNEWFRASDIPYMTTTLFFEDKDGDIRLMLHHAPHEDGHALFKAEHKDESGCEVHQGRLAKTLFPDPFKNSFLHIMRQVLEEEMYHEFPAYINGSIRTVVAMPIIDRNNQVSAGLLTIGPFHAAWDRASSDASLQGGEDGPMQQSMAEPMVPKGHKRRVMDQTL